MNTLYAIWIINTGCTYPREEKSVMGGKLPTSSPTLSNSFVCPKPLTEISQDSLDDLSGSLRKFPAETSRSPCDKINVLSLEASAETVMFGGPDLFSGLDDDED